MIEFLLWLPLWALALFLNAWLMGFSLVGLWAFRRWIMPRLRLDTNATLFYGAAVMQSAMVLYGLVAALTAVSVWTRHSQVSDIVSSEATAIAGLWRDLGGYPSTRARCDARRAAGLHRPGHPGSLARADEEPDSARGRGVDEPLRGAAPRRSSPRPKGRRSSTPRR